MPMLPADKPPAIEGTPTMPEADAPSERITLSEHRRERPMSDAERAELEAFRLQDKDGKPVIAVTTKQLTSLVTVLTTIASVILGGGYFTMSSQVETVVDEQVDASVADKVVEDVAVKDAANRQIVKEELAAVMIDVTARVDADRKAFTDKLDGVNKSIAAIDKKLEKQDAADVEQRKELDRKFTNIERNTRDIQVDISLIKGQTK